jgi:hypothetical protein
MAVHPVTALVRAPARIGHDFCILMHTLRDFCIDLARTAGQGAVMTYATFYFAGYFTNATREGAVAG